MDPQAITKQFLDAYYQCMSNNRMGLLDFFTNDSCMSYEGDSYKGLAAIKEKLESMVYSAVSYNLTQIKYEFDEYDLQPSPFTDGILIVVIGGLKIEDNPPFKFTQTFQLIPNGKGGYYIHNDILRLIYGAN